MTSGQRRRWALVTGLTAVAALTITTSQTRADELSSVAAVPQSTAPYAVANFSKVSYGIWRGAAPTGEALGQLSRGGVKTVIDLRLDGPGTRQERADATNLGLRYYHFPLGFNVPNTSELKDILSIATNPVNQPCFIHCRQGADRTGTVVALYRRIWMGWSFDQAYREMRDHHFKPFLLTLRRTVEHPEELHIAPATTAFAPVSPIPTNPVLPTPVSAASVISQQSQRLPIIIDQ